MPIGATPVTIIPRSKIGVNVQEFLYQPWKNDDFILKNIHDQISILYGNRKEETCDIQNKKIYCDALFFP